MSDYIKREDVLDFLDGIYDCNDMVFKNDICDRTADCSSCRWQDTKEFIASRIARFPAADVRPVPDGGIGEMSDGYHTFNGLYYQRMVLFAALVNAYNGNAWKSWKHEDGEPCFGGGWFIVGIDTPQGIYTYHYEDEYWNWFKCKELPVAKHWDGHTEEDVTRLLSLDVVERKSGEWIDMGDFISCSACNATRLKEFESDYGKVMRLDVRTNYCPNCGADMRGSANDNPNAD